ncbi:DUF2971 domain-containing protein [Pseudarthrobacter oxydans]|jgi:hypothetical protein|uniref:DUF2971 domain-containing protein n=1 Tax=Pseudarthrobacter oxydans TaxID=1671 RepID=UPI00344CBC91
MTVNPVDNVPWSYEPGDLVWHYTNGPALKNILTNHELWAGNTAFMNDTGERRLADQYLRDAKKRMGDVFPPALDSYLDHVGDWYDNLRFTGPNAPDGTRYLLSASRSGDSLTMWRGYAGTDEVSYAVGLDRRQCLKVLAPASLDVRRVGRSNEVKGWFDVSYDPQRAKKRARVAVREILDTYSIASGNRDSGDAEVFKKIEDVTEELRDETKHEGFRHEEESRIIVKAEQQLARYRPGKLGMIPYVAITGSDGSAGPLVHIANKLPIREIFISPGRDRFYAARSLNFLLENCGYGGSYFEPWHSLINEIKIRVSSTPFR